MRVFLITDEDSLWEVIEAIASPEFNDEFSISLKNYKPSQIKIQGGRYDNNIGTSAMYYYVDLQKKIRFSYAIARYGTQNVKKITEEESKNLEIFVEITEGSSIIETTISDVAGQFISGALQKMTGTQVTLVFLFGMAAFLGTSIFRAWLHYRIEEKRILLNSRRDEKNTEEKIHLIEALDRASKADVNRMSLFVNFARNDPDLAIIKNKADENYREKLKLARSVNSIESDGLSINSDAADELLKTFTPEPIPVQLNGLYKVEKANHIPLNYHLFSLADPQKNTIINNVKLMNLLAAGDVGRKIAETATRKELIGLQINGRLANDEIVDAEIVGLLI
jgi:hypothetical protein